MALVIGFCLVGFFLGGTLGAAPFGVIGGGVGSLVGLVLGLVIGLAGRSFILRSENPSRPGG